MGAAGVRRELGWTHRAAKHAGDRGAAASQGVGGTPPSLLCNSDARSLCLAAATPRTTEGLVYRRVVRDGARWGDGVALTEVERTHGEGSASKQATWWETVQDASHLMLDAAALRESVSARVNAEYTAVHSLQGQVRRAVAGSAP